MSEKIDGHSIYERMIHNVSMCSGLDREAAVRVLDRLKSKKISRDMYDGFRTVAERQLREETDDE